MLSSTFPRWKDDTEPRFVYDLCQRLKDTYKILVLSPHCQGSKTFEKLDGLDVHRYRYAPRKLETLAYVGGITTRLKTNPINGLLVPFFFVAQWFAILKLLKSHPVKVIHAHWLIPQGALAIAARFISRRPTAVLCTSHGADLFGLRDPISTAIKKLVLRHSDIVTVVSRAMQDKARSLSPSSQIPIIAPMGVDLQELFTPKNSIEREPFRLLFVGRLVEKKGLRYLLQALPSVIDQFPSATLWIAGEGPEKPHLIDLAKQLGVQAQTHFVGSLSHKKLVDQYRKSCIAVFPFIQANDGDMEGLGLVVIEALGCECPVIASQLPAIKDILIHNQTGLLANPADPGQIEKQIKQLFSFPDLAKYLAAAGRKHVKKHYDWNVTSTKYLKIISKHATTHS